MYNSANEHPVFQEIEIDIVRSVLGMTEIGKMNSAVKPEVLGLEIVWMAKSVALIFLAAISWENAPSNIRNHTVHAISRA